MTGLYPRDQMLKIIHAWRVDVQLPRKGGKTVVTFPDTDQYDFKQATITVADDRSTYGKVLFKVEFQKPRAQAVVNDMLDEIPPKGFVLGGAPSASPIGGGGQG